MTKCLVMMMQASLLFFLLPLVLAATVTLSSPVKCSSENTACEVHEGTLLESVGGVTSLQECRQLCYESPHCQFITYFSNQSFPFSEICSLFLSCEEIYTCSSCLTETRDCYQTCSHQFYGRMDQNLVHLVGDVSSEVECKVE